MERQVTEEASIGAYVSLEVKGDAMELVRLINQVVRRDYYRCYPILLVTRAGEREIKSN
jgi:hypothetical protein